MKLTNNFALEEFIESRFYNKEVQENVWEDYEMNREQLEPNIVKLAESLQALRDYIGKAVNINISYRPVWWELQNKRDGTSQHCLGKAADLVVKGMKPDELADTIEKLIAEDKMSEGGLGRYNSFTHYDVRGTKARWDNR